MERGGNVCVFLGEANQCGAWKRGGVVTAGPTLPIAAARRMLAGKEWRGEWMSGRAGEGERIKGSE